MFSYFTELNRKRPPVGLLDFVSHATCPIVHAADDRSVIQTLEAIPHIVRSARAIVGEAPYRLGPSTIGMRQNPYRSEEHTSELQSLMRISYAVFCLIKKKDTVTTLQSIKPPQYIHGKTKTDTHLITDFKYI